MLLPLARTEKLTIREMPEETLVFDQEKHKAHCLNRTAALVWKHCDGKTTTGEMARILHEELAIPASEAVVQLAVEQLERRNLLQQAAPPLPEHQRCSRRDALKKIAVAAATLPLVMTLTAKRARAQATVFRSSADCLRETCQDGGGGLVFCSNPTPSGTSRFRCTCAGRRVGQPCTLEL